MSKCIECIKKAENLGYIHNIVLKFALQAIHSGYILALHMGGNHSVKLLQHLISIRVMETNPYLRLLIGSTSQSMAASTD